MKKNPGPLLYVGQPNLEPVQPVMQNVAKAETAEEAETIELTVEDVEAVSNEKPSAQRVEEVPGPGRLKPFREMNTTEKVIYLAQRRIPVPCRFEWSGPSVSGTIQSFDETYVWILGEESPEPVQVPIADIVYIRLAGT